MAHVRLLRQSSLGLRRPVVLFLPRRRTPVVPIGHDGEQSGFTSDSSSRQSLCVRSACPILRPDSRALRVTGDKLGITCRDVMRHVLVESRCHPNRRRRSVRIVEVPTLNASTTCRPHPCCGSFAVARAGLCGQSQNSSPTPSRRAHHNNLTRVRVPPTFVIAREAVHCALPQKAGSVSSVAPASGKCPICQSSETASLPYISSQS